MRNLKRVLSLTLASVMLLGMMVIGSSAAAQGYDDVDETHNVEAIEVLQAVGVMVGDGDGNLRPDADVSRGEMAVIMAKLMDLNFQYYSAAGIHPFNDMVGHYAEAYVAACKANGIIAGRSDTVYDPNAGVTAIEAASMMMRALGYFKYSSDYAAGFEVSTVTQGTKIGIFDGVGSDATTPMTRNQVAQLALNALESGMVEPSSTVSVTTSDGTVVTAGNVAYHYINSTETYAGAIYGKTSADYGQSYDGNSAVVELGEQLFKGDLVLNSTRDAFGRHSNQWFYKDTEVGIYAKDLIKTYTSGVKKSELYNLLGSMVYNNYTLNVYANGRDVIPGVTGTIAAKDAAFNYVANRSNFAGDAKGTGNGVLTEIYKNDDARTVTIVEINTYVAKVLTDYDEARDAVNVEIVETDNGTPYDTNGYSRTNMLTGASNFKGVLYAEDFPLVADLKEGDYILFTYSTGVCGNDDVEEICLAELVTGPVTSITDDDASKLDDDSTLTGRLKEVVIGGEPYGYNKNYSNRGEATTHYELGTDATVVLDQYGYIIWDAEAIAGSNNFVYIDGMVRSSGRSATAIADAYFADGTNGSIEVSEITVRYTPFIGVGGYGIFDDGTENYDVDGANVTHGFVTNNSVDSKGVVTIKNLPTGTNDGKSPATTYEMIPGTYTSDTAANVQFDGWYSYTVKADGTYKLTQLWRDNADPGDGGYAAHDNQVAYARLNGADAGSSDGKAVTSVTIPAASTRWWNALATDVDGVATGLTVGDPDTGTRFYNGFSANDDTVFILVKNGKVSVYEGVKNLPEITLNPKDNENDPRDHEQDAIVTAAKKGDSNVASVVLIMDDDMKISGKKSEDLLYVIKLNSSRQEQDVNGNAVVYKYDVILNGVKTTIESKDYLTDAYGNSGKVYQAYTSWSIIDGYYDFDTEDQLTTEGNTNSYVVEEGSNKDMSYKGSRLWIGDETYYISADTKIAVLLTFDKGTYSGSTGRYYNQIIGNSGSENEVRIMSPASLASLLNSTVYSNGLLYDYYGVLDGDWDKGNDELRVLYVVVRIAY